jgi:hypothetical protein
MPDNVYYDPSTIYTPPAQPSYLAPTYPQPAYINPSTVPTVPSTLATRYATAPVQQPNAAGPWVDPATTGTPPTLYLGQRQSIGNGTMLLLGGALLIIVLAMK